MTSPVVTVGPDTSVKEAARLLLRHSISAAPVVDEGGRLVGIVSELDLLLGDVPADPVAHVIPTPPEQAPPPRRVSDVMTGDVLALAEDTDAADVARLMRESSLKSIPVLRGDAVVGIVSRRDLLRSIARDDAAVREDVLLRLREYADGLVDGQVGVDAGVVTIAAPPDEVAGRTALLLARSVPGALRVHLVDRTRPDGSPSTEAPP
jgi:CBS domain-containing protein